MIRRTLRCVTPALLAAALVACGSIEVNDGSAAPGGGGGGGGGGGAEGVTCEALCEVMAEACPADGSHGQFGSDAVCEPTCADFAGWVAGWADDYSANSIGCRINHAESALLQPATHCAHAGPTGGGQCGSFCENYCWLAQRNCAGEASLYPGTPACVAACAGFATDGAVGDDSSDTVQCRVTHLILAGLEPATAPEHCPDGADDSPVCVEPTAGADAPPTCADYCALYEITCEPDHPQYDWADGLDCETWCTTWAGLEPGGAGADAGNSIGCRAYHAGVAAQVNPQIHCPHAGPSGGNVCGSWCDNYCDLAARNCKAGDTLFASDEECETACEGIAADGAPGDLSGDTVQCRISVLGLAGSALPGSAAEWCADGAPGASDTCQ